MEQAVQGGVQAWYTGTVSLCRHLPVPQTHWSSVVSAGIVNTKKTSVRLFSLVLDHFPDYSRPAFLVKLAKKDGVRQAYRDLELAVVNRSTLRKYVSLSLSAKQTFPEKSPFFLTESLFSW